jgi:hypothetical protein
MDSAPSDSVEAQNGEVHAHEHDASCSGHASTCGIEGDACCGGHATDMFAFPTTDEIVAIPAPQLAGLLDLVEKLIEDPRSLVHEPDYVSAERLLTEQAPRLMELREEFLERLKVVMAQQY